MALEFFRQHCPAKVGQYYLNVMSLASLLHLINERTPLSFSLACVLAVITVSHGIKAYGTPDEPDEYPPQKLALT